MRRLIVGDVHGCYDELRDPLDKVGLAAHDNVIAIGDIVIMTFIAKVRDERDPDATQAQMTRVGPLAWHRETASILPGKARARSATARSPGNAQAIGKRTS